MRESWGLLYLNCDILSSVTCEESWGLLYMWKSQGLLYTDLNFEDILLSITCGESTDLLYIRRALGPPVITFNP